jgi:DnaJ-related protein SCJ1
MMGMIMNTQAHCPVCGGRGKTMKHRCPICGGQRVKPATKKFDVVVEQGMKNGDTIIFKGESEQNPDYLPGDVMYVIYFKHC